MMAMGNAAGFMDVEWVSKWYPNELYMYMGLHMYR